MDKSKSMTEFLAKTPEQKSAEFREVIEPVMDWLARTQHPHMTIIVTAGDAELLEGQSGVVNKNLPD